MVSTDESLTPSRAGMETILAVWWVFLWRAFFVTGAGDYWESLKQELDAKNGAVAALKIAQNWGERPLDFFLGLGGERWRKITRHLSYSQINSIKTEEFDSMAPEVLKAILYQSKACPTTSISFWTEERMEYISSGCLGKILTENKAPVKLGKLWREISLPVLHDFTEVMVPSLRNIDLGDFRFMQPAVSKMILISIPELCSAFEVEAWTEEMIEGISAECLHNIIKATKQPVKLGKLWQRISWLVWDRFTEDMMPSFRNIDPDDFRFMRPIAIEKILEFIPDLCSTLNVEVWTEETIEGISARCLHELLTRHEKPVKLGKLWQKISWPALYGFTQDMVPSLRNIDLSDFRFMQPNVLEKILEFIPELCSVLELEVWTEETTKSISAKCLHSLLTKHEKPVELRKMWQEINWLVLYDFTEDMVPSLQNIDLGDFHFMQSDAIEKITQLIPKLCSVLGVEVWTKEIIERISNECLHNIFKAPKQPIKLGSLWNSIRKDSVYYLLSNQGSFLDHVHPDDRVLAENRIGEIFVNDPGICGHLDISFWRKETSNYMTADCLYRTTNQTRKPVVLGELWGHISTPVLEEFEKSMLDRVKNVAGSDFQFMPPSLLKSIFSSQRVLEYLPRPLQEIILSEKASELSMSSVQFEKMVKSAPTVAGQLLWYSRKLPENVLAHCKGDDIRQLKLTIPGEAELDWKDLFARLESKWALDGRAEFFGKMIQSISDVLIIHFCATLSDLDECLSLTWLHHNQSEKCFSLLPSKPKQASRLFSTLDLSGEKLPWEKMLGVYNDSDWALVSKSKRVAALLGGDCEFWGAIEAGNWVGVFKALDTLALKSIIPECVLRIPGILANSPEKIPLLADDAFSKHVTGQLPCRLNILSPAQIALLSTRTFSNTGGSTTKEISQHALSAVTLDDLKTLNLQQFKSLCGLQWAFLPGSIKKDALTWQLDSALSRILDCAANLKSERPFRWVVKNNNVNLKIIENTLGLVLEIYRHGHQEITESGLVSLFASLGESDLRGTFTKFFAQSILLRPTMIGMVRNAGELRDYNQKAFTGMSVSQAWPPLSHARQSGFDRSCMVKLLKEKPESFAAPNARVESQGIVDNGGAIRALADQLLSDIGRDLVVPYIRVARVDQELPDKREGARADTGGNMMEIKDSNTDFETSLGMKALQVRDATAGNSKFGWAVSREAGSIVGLALGKALQLDIQMPFALDLAFYRLLIDTSDVAIDGYYKNTYSREISEFRKNVRGLLKSGSLEDALDVLPRLNSLRFTTLSTQASAEDAQKDVSSRTNLWGCSDKDCYENVKELEGESFAEEYISSILNALQNEFKEFVRELVRGLGMALPAVKNFSSLPLPILRPFARFLPELLNASPVKGEDVLARVEFIQDEQVASLVQGQAIDASEVFSAFVTSLGAKQLERLIGIWTGSSTLMLKHTQLSVTFMPPGNIEAYQVDFCKANKGKSYLIASGDEYKTFFSKFSQRLVGAETSPDCRAEGVSIVPVRPSTCAKDLMVYLQSAEQMLNSLVDLLRTPLTTLRDE